MNLNGPVPIGALLLGFWPMGVSTSYRCLGRMAPPPMSNAYRNAEYGCFNLKTTVCASGADTSCTLAINVRVRGVLARILV
ncbi:hypothetical protein D3C71_1892580 [compost metagenome]